MGEAVKKIEQDYSTSFLNKSTLKSIFEHTQGNPRDIIKILIKLFNDLIDDEENFDLILKKYENRDN